MRRPCDRIHAASSTSSAVCPRRMTRAPACRAASTSTRCRASRAAAGSPVAGLRPRQTRVRCATPRLRQRASHHLAQVAPSGRIWWSTVTAIRRRPALAAQSRDKRSSARESPPPENPTRIGAASRRARRRSNTAAHSDPSHRQFAPGGAAREARVASIAWIPFSAARSSPVPSSAALGLSLQIASFPQDRGSHGRIPPGQLAQGLAGVLRLAEGHQ